MMTALERDGGAAVIYYPDLGLRDWLIGEVESLAPASARPVRVAEVEEIFAHPDRLVLFVSDDERRAVEDLDGNRDRLRAPARAPFPVVLFLLRDGAGQRALADAPGLASWVRGSDPDPERLAEVDSTAERAAFAESTGDVPEAWLARWRRNEIPQTAENLAHAYRAALLVAP
ncbi:MAG: hypothetical protein Q8S73_25905 [Deltaproteobacteria bacterium]|nr:hypothetical protein [Myxococcales bacterium]MDP3217572.1 hypothetical protein [Deltaproteobacteria bacterium]